MISRGELIGVLLGTAALFGAFYWFWRMDEQKATRIASSVVEVIRPRTPPWWRKFMRISWRFVGVWFILGGTYALIRVVMTLPGAGDSGEPWMGMGVFGAVVVIGVLFVRYADRLSKPPWEP